MLRSHPSIYFGSASGKKTTYDANLTSRFKIIKRHETKLKWIKLLHTLYPLGFNDKIYDEGNISKMPDFLCFFFVRVA